jgi:CheY-like chemotaxis protein/two-component sensor histidine kinase
MIIQERLRALGEMASGIAHDIGNALSPIVGYSDLLLCEENDLSDRARKFLEIIKRAGSDINHTVARMKEFYRHRDEREELRPVRLNEAAEQVIDLTRPRWRDMCQRKGIMIQIKTDFQEDLPVVMGIESEIREAVTNLVLNSVDAMPQGGSITLRTRATSDQVVLTVSDEGVGMDAETRRRCVEPFYSTKGEEGSGLGLTIVVAIMQRHGGDVRIWSEPGKGATVDLSFRPDGAEISDVQAESFPLVRGIPPSQILCIDDDVLIRDLVTEMLKRDGHSVETAENGQVGLNTFRAAARLGEPFDAVIVDFGMPYLDGREVAQRIKRESPRTPVVLLTAWAKELKAQDKIPDRADAILEKPPNIEDLRTVLSKVVRPRR